MIVVGAGPGGALCAYLLAHAGAKVILLEKSMLPRYKPCGGGLTLRALKYLPFDPSDAVEVYAVGGKLTWEGRLILEKSREPFVAAMVMRDRFDTWLVDKAQAAGAFLMDATPVLGVEELDAGVQVETPGRIFRATYLVGADGVNSIVARQFPNFRRATGVALEAEVEVPSAALDAQGFYLTFDFGILPQGYGWIFPKGDHLSIGVFAAHEGRIPDLKAHLMRFMACYPHVINGKVHLLRGHRIPLGGQRQILHTRRMVLVGDAANLADAFLGEGISYALWSAHLASQVIWAGLTNHQVGLATYTKRVQKTLGRELRFAARLGQWVYSHSKQAATVLATSPKLQTMWLDTLTARQSFARLVLTLPLCLPLIMVQYLRNRPPRQW
ncbi:MAG: geranylgeranyl reductase family protein [Thermanaerothrix sp.]|nr:geranylgeranyl reductase family protein [Thermanaerothrix sp.]